MTDTTPAWSPDGRLIAFASDRAGPFNTEIYVMRPDGRGVRRLTRTAGGDAVLGDDSTPAWSPTAPASHSRATATGTPRST